MNCLAFERNSKVRYRVHKSTSHIPVLHKINPVQADQYYLCKIIIKFILPSTSSFSFRLTHQILCTFPFSPTRATCHVCYWAKTAKVWHSSSTHRYRVRSTVLKDVSFVCVHVWGYVYFQWGINTGCPRRNVPDFGRVFFMLKYTDITQNTYVQSWTVAEIKAREKCGVIWRQFSSR